MTNFLSKKKFLPPTPNLTNLSIVHAQTTSVIPQISPKPNLAFFKATSINILPDESVMQEKPVNTPLSMEVLKNYLKQAEIDSEKEMLKRREKAKQDREKDLLEFSSSLRSKFGLPH